MAEKPFCEACDMPFDWEGVAANGSEYCCEGCARGERCTCTQHAHQEIYTRGLRDPATGLPTPARGDMTEPDTTEEVR